MKNTFSINYEKIDGMHIFTSSTISGLFAGHKNIKLAWLDILHSFMEINRGEIYR